MADLKSVEELRRLRPEVLGAVIQWLNVRSANLTGTRPRPSLGGVYPGVVAVYSLVLVASVIVNCCLVLYAYRNRLYLLLNFGLANLLLSCPVLPPTVAVLISHDWLLGRTTCHVLPLLQDMSINLTMLSHLSLVVDAYREVQGQTRPSPRVVVMASWLVSLGLVLPYRPHITYVDLAILGSQFRGLGICYASLNGHIREYIRTVTLLVYFLPVCIITSLYVRMRRALSISLRHLNMIVEPRGSLDSASSPTTYRSTSKRSHVELQRAEVQDCYMQVQCLGVATAICCLCLCPLMLLRLTKTRPVEVTSSKGGSGLDGLDLLYCLVIWLTFLPSLISPLSFLFSEFKRLICCWKKQNEKVMINCFNVGAGSTTVLNANIIS